MFVLHEELVLGGADGAARSPQASLLRPPPLRGPIAELVGPITQLPLPWRPQYRDLVRMGVTLPCQSIVKVLALIRSSFRASNRGSKFRVGRATSGGGGNLKRNVSIQLNP